MISRHFRVPPANTSEAFGRSQAQVFDDYCYLTQLQQARCYTTAFGAWRRQMSTAATNMGILYWQLNDVWQGPTWSTIEVDGTPKLSHHATRRAFAPLLISAVEVQSGALPGGVASGGRGRGGGASLEVHITSDLAVSQLGVLTVEVVRFADAPAAPAAGIRRNVTVTPRADAAYVTVSLDDILATARTDRRHALVRMRFTPASDASAAVEAEHWLMPPKDVALPLATLSITDVHSLTPTSARLRLAANATAVFVAVESHAVVGAMSDGAFTLLAGMEVDVTFTARRQFDIAEFKRGLVVRSLRDTYD